MKTNHPFLSSVRSHASEFFRLALLLVLAVVKLSAANAAEPVWLPPGPVAVTAPEAPAAYRLDRGEGQIESTLDRAQAFARGSASHVTEFRGTVGFGGMTDFGAPGVVLAPVAALVGASGAKNKRLDSATLALVESRLQATLASMAAQKHLRDAVLQVAANQPHRRFVAMNSQADSVSFAMPISAVIQAKVEEIHLRRTGKNDESFALCVKSHARVVRALDGKTVLDESFEHKSEPALFLDWSLGSALQNVAGTSYRRLAERIVDRLLAAAREETALVGAGFRTPYLPPAPVGHLAAVAAGHSPGTYRTAAGATFGVYATSSVPQLVIQAPRTKNQAVMEARSDLAERHLGEIVDFPNPTVSSLGLVAAIPMGLFKQGSAMINGLSEARFLKADKQISLAAHQMRLHEGIALAVVGQLAPQTSQAVALVPQPKPTGDLYQAAVMQCSMNGTLTALPRGVTARDYLVSQGMTQALEVHVTKAVLKSNGGVSPSMALHLEATAAVLRSEDGQIIFACPVRYQGKARKFEEWAANEARLLRQELETSYAELGKAISTQLVARRVLPPKSNPENLLASH